MSAKKKRKITSAIAAQRELEELFWEAKERKDARQAAFVLQTWISAEKYALPERLNKSTKKNALDRLCDILAEKRKEYEEDNNDD